MYEINQVDLAENWHDRIVKFEKYYTIVSLDYHFHPLKALSHEVAVKYGYNLQFKTVFSPSEYRVRKNLV
jgi:hypothetical protein